MKIKRGRRSNARGTNNTYIAVAVILASLVLAMVYVTAPIPVRASPKVYLMGEMAIFYTDGSTEEIATPKTVFEKTAMSLNDFFKSLSTLERGGKAVDKVRAEFWLEADAPIPVVIKAQVSGSVHETIKKSVIIDGPVKIYAREFTAQQILASMPEGGRLQFTMDALMATMDGVYQAKAELVADFSVRQESTTTTTPTTPPPAPTTPATQQVEVTETAATQEQSFTPAPVTTTTSTSTTSPKTGYTVDDPEYQEIVQNMTGKPFTYDITVKTRPGGYQPTPGSLAAQDQYSYDVTDFFMTLRSTGDIPPNWVYEGTDQFGQKMYRNIDTGSTLVMGV